MNRLGLFLYSAVVIIVVSTQFVVTSASSSNNVPIFQQCVLKVLCQSTPFTDEERTYMNKVIKETILRMQLLNLDADDVLNARTMLRLFSASLSQMVGRTHTKDKTEGQERKLAYLSALETCSPHLSESLIDELLKEAARIITTMDKPYSPYIQKEDMKSISTEDVQTKKEAMAQQRVKRSTDRMLQVLRTAISNALVSSPAFQNTFKPGITQTDAAYYAKEMVESALMGYTTEVVTDATNSVINTLSFMAPTSMPQNYSFAFAESIVTVLQSHDIAFFASGRSIGNMLAVQLQRMINSQTPQSAPIINPSWTGTKDNNPGSSERLFITPGLQPNTDIRPILSPSNMQRPFGFLSGILPNPQGNPAQFSSAGRPNQQITNRFQNPPVQNPNTAPLFFNPSQQFNPPQNPAPFVPRPESQPLQFPPNFGTNPFDAKPVANPPFTEFQDTANQRFTNPRSGPNTGPIPAKRQFNPTNTQTFSEGAFPDSLPDFKLPSISSSFPNVPDYNPGPVSGPSFPAHPRSDSLPFAPSNLPQDATNLKQSPNIYPSFDIFIPPDLLPTLFDHKPTGLNTDSAVPQPDTAFGAAQPERNPNSPLMPETSSAKTFAEPNPLPFSSDSAPKTDDSQQPPNIFPNPQEPLPMNPGPFTDGNPPNHTLENAPTPNNGDNQQPESFLPFSQEPLPMGPEPFIGGNPQVPFDDILKATTAEYVTEMPVSTTESDNVCTTDSPFSVSPTQPSISTTTSSESPISKDLATRLMDEILDTYHNLSSVDIGSISKSGSSTPYYTSDSTTSLTTENETMSSTTVSFDEDQQKPTEIPGLTTEGITTSANPTDVDLADPSQIFAEDISSIASDSMAYIKSPHFNLSVICEKLNKLASIVDIPPLNVCSEMALVDYLLHVLKAVVNVLRVL